MRIALYAASAACSLLAACGTTQVGLAPLGGAATSPDTGNYAARAAAGNLFEMRAAQLALTQAQRPDVRALAGQLVAEHSGAAQSLAAALADAGLGPLDPALTASQQRMLDELQGAPAAAFDALYLRQQLAAHEEARRLHRAYALSGDAEPVRFVAAASSAAAVGHREALRRIRREAGLD